VDVISHPVQLTAINGYQIARGTIDAKSIG
jgi:hypothetical protein